MTGNRGQVLRELSDGEIVRGLRGLAADLYAVGNDLAADFLDEVADRVTRTNMEVCTVERCGRFARYLVFNTETGRGGFACPEHHGTGDSADVYFDMHQGPVT